MGSASSSFVATLGVDTANSSLAVKSGENVDFLVTRRRQPHFQNFASTILLPDDPVSTIRTYTEHTNGIYAKINLALAADSPVLAEHGPFIQQLRASILSKPLVEDVLLYRGVDLSQREITEMEALKDFFIPSFASTSIDRDKAYSKNSLLIIKAPYSCKHACSITEDLSAHYSTEREVLLACYNAYRMEKIEKVNNRNFITLYLDDVACSMDTI